MTMAKKKGVRKGRVLRGHKLTNLAQMIRKRSCGVSIRINDFRYFRRTFYTNLGRASIHAQESREAAERKSVDVVDKLRAMKLPAAAELVGSAIHETLAYYAYPPRHWLKIKTNNPMERLLKEARWRTMVIGAFPDGNSALMLVSARLRHVSGTHWGTRKYMNMKLLNEMDQEAIYSVA